jgi:HK97 family phage portal protein
MGWRQRVAGWIGGERKMTSLELFREIYGGRSSKSGVAVNWKTALEVTTALACLRVMANGVAQVPLKLFREEGGRRVPATDHPLYAVLNARPNEWQTSYEYRETLLFHAALTGNHCSFVNRIDGGRRISELIPFEPSSVSIERQKGGSPRYFVTNPEGERREFPRESIWHVRGPSWNSWMGLSTIDLIREAVGLSIATENAHANLHRGGVQSSGTYSVEGALTKEQYKQLRDWLAKFRDGGEYAGEPLILDREAKYLQTAMSGVDSQHIETRNLQIEEVCRGLGVLPIMVGHSDKATTYASAEQMFLAHVVHTLAPWYERIEQSINANLLTEADRKAGIYAKFIEEGLLRGSLKDTKDTLLGYVNGGLMYPNEARAKLDLNPDSDPKSDELRIPANVVGAKPEADPTVDAAAEDAKKALAMANDVRDRLADRKETPITVNVAPPSVVVNTPEMKMPKKPA